MIDHLNNWLAMRVGSWVWAVETYIPTLFILSTTSPDNWAQMWTLAGVFAFVL